MNNMEYQVDEGSVLIRSSQVIITGRSNDSHLELCALTPDSIAEMDDMANDPDSPIECIGCNTWSKVYRFPEELLTISENFK